MNGTPFRWMLYVSAYTALLGVPFLFFPNAVLPALGFNATPEPWVRLCGTLLLAFSAITFNIRRLRIEAMLIPSMFVRSGIALVLVVLGLSGYPFFFVMAGVVLFGVLGTFLSVRHARGATAR